MSYRPIVIFTIALIIIFYLVEFASVQSLFNFLEEVIYLTLSLLQCAFSQTFDLPFSYLFCIMVGFPMM